MSHQPSLSSMYCGCVGVGVGMDDITGVCVCVHACVRVSTSS